MINTKYVVNDVENPPLALDSFLVADQPVYVLASTLSTDVFTLQVRSDDLSGPATWTDVYTAGGVLQQLKDTITELIVPFRGQYRLVRSGAVDVASIVTISTTAESADEPPNLYQNNDPSGGGGGAALAFWVEANDNTGINSAVSLNAWRPLGNGSSPSNADAAVVPAGTGALLAGLPDGTAFGGNKRGANAVDLQLTRFQPTEIASGPQSTIAGGQGNKADGQYSAVLGGIGCHAGNVGAAVVGGDSNSALGSHAFAGGGNNVVATGDFSAIPGGKNNNVTGDYSAIAGGHDNAIPASAAAIGGGLVNVAAADASFIGGGSNNRTISGHENSVIPGGSFGKSRSRGSFNFSSGGAGDTLALGTSQSGEYTLTAVVFDATPTDLLLQIGHVADLLNVPLSSMYVFDGLVGVKETDGGTDRYAAWKIEGVIRCFSTAASVVLSDTTITPIANASGLVLTAAAVTAGPNGALVLTFTGIAGLSAVVTARIRTSEVIAAALG